MTLSTHPEIKTRLMVGMEIHVELATRSKMWTGAPNVAHPDHFDAEPNTLLDPVVLGMPGTLPVMNKTALEMSMLVGLALGCEIARSSKWDRKSYYYPDLPKNYQISQYDEPICGEGELEFTVGDGPDAPLKKVRIIRAHLEEDAGKLLHEAPGGFAIDYSIVDLNRAGTPLLEIVTFPDIESPEEAVAFAQALRNICRALGVTEGIMQRGHIRFEPNINVIIEKDGQTFKTPIAEIKNLNSFKAVHGAITHEYERQVEQWLRTGVVMKPGTKSTRGWNDATNTTFLQREKEEADDYRYFPDPDLVPVIVTDEWLDELRAKLPELPRAKERRYLELLKLNPADARQLLDEPRTADFFDAVVAAGADANRAAKLLLNTAAKRANEKGCRIDQLGASAVQIKAILDLLSESKISATGADDLLGLCCEEANHDASPLALAEARGLLQVSDSSALEGFVDTVLNDPKNARAIADLKAGKDKAIGSLMGQVMKLSKGQANPAVVTELIRKRVSG
ncbi:MAG: Asp-tRNA(Asn)/Glu-tRNA(Gln) amidotransferase subunit GatB [Phycisphaeraceae bacterium]